MHASAAVGVRPQGEGAEKLIVYVILSRDCERGQLVAELSSVLAKNLNPLFKMCDLVVTEQLPRTASNKLMRRKLRSLYKGEQNALAE